MGNRFKCNFASTNIFYKVGVALGLYVLAHILSAYAKQISVHLIFRQHSPLLRWALCCGSSGNRIPGHQLLRTALRLSPAFSTLLAAPHISGHMHDVLREKQLKWHFPR